MDQAYQWTKVGFNYAIHVRAHLGKKPAHARLEKEERFRKRETLPDALACKEAEILRSPLRRVVVIQALRLI